MERNNPIVTVESLEKSYRGTKAVKGVSFQVRPGEIFGLIGPDGAGKSTVMKILAGVLSHKKGHVEVLGKTYPKEAEKAKKELAFMPQGIGLNLYMDLTVAENLQFFAHLRGLPPSLKEKREDLLLKATGLSPFKGRMVRNLSGGMQQKLGLCSSLMASPRLLILDEPTTGVDPLSRREFWDILFDFVVEGMTVILSTSYMEEAERCHNIAFMMDGEIIYLGNPQELTGAHGHLEKAFFSMLKEKRPLGLFFSLPPDAKRREARGEPAVEVQGLTKRFGAFTAVDNLSFTIEEGETFGLLGPNGAGKTTAIKSMVGLLDPTHGEIRIAGWNRKTQLPFIKRQMGYMSQKFSLYRDLTVSENIELYAALYGLRGEGLRRRKGWVVEIANLKGEEKKLVKDIPLGLKQRLALGCALLHLPRVLFLDEPTSGVDPLARRHFWEIITRLAQEMNISFLVTTHHLVEAEFCHRLALMNQARLVALGTPHDLRGEVVKEKGRMLELKIEPQREGLQILKAAGYQVYPFGRSLRMWSKGVRREIIRDALKKQGVHIASIEEALVSMEDVFIHFMEKSTYGQRNH